MAARILVIEDNSSLLALYHALFREAGYEVALQSSPQPDPATISQVAPDLIVLDLLFDGNLTGWDALQALKLQPATSSIPVVVCSAATKYLDVLQAAFTTLDVQVITKPFQLETLLDVINELLNNKAMLSQTGLSYMSLQ
jgi:CheY-like chemotaxis protein